MVKTLHSVLSRRERQIIDILYRRGRATAADVMEDLPGDPSYSTVRTQLRVLEDKGHVRHEEEGQRYVYTPGGPARHRPAVRIEASRRDLLRRVGGAGGGSAPRRARGRGCPMSSSIGSRT